MQQAQCMRVGSKGIVRSETQFKNEDVAAPDARTEYSWPLQEIGMKSQTPPSDTRPAAKMSRVPKGRPSIVQHGCTEPIPYPGISSSAWSVVASPGLPESRS